MNVQSTGRDLEEPCSGSNSKTPGEFPLTWGGLSSCSIQVFSEYTYTCISMYVLECILKIPHETMSFTLDF